MALKAGSKTGTQPGNYEHSMAAAMEKAFEIEWLQVKGTPLLGANRLDLQLMFTAIAQGVVRHLQDRESSFVIQVADTAGSVDIATEGVIHTPSY